MNTEKLVHGLTTAATGYDVSRHIHHDAVPVVILLLIKAETANKLV